MSGRTHPRCRGFTVVELAVSMGVLSITLATGSIIAQSAMKSAGTSVTQAEETTRTARTSRALETRLVSAGQSTLQGVPQGGQVEEPLVDGVDYESVSFRAAVSFADGAVVYAPGPEAAPYRIWFERNTGPWAGQSGEGYSGSLMYYDGVRDRALVEKVAEVSIVKDGSALALRWVAPACSGDLASVEKKIILKAQ